MNYNIAVFPGDGIGPEVVREGTEPTASEFARALAHPYFIQMKGRARLGGRVGGRPVEGEGAGFFETYR